MIYSISGIETEVSEQLQQHEETTETISFAIANENVLPADNLSLEGILL
jgi:hypothetical protein